MARKLLAVVVVLVCGFPTVALAGPLLEAGLTGGGFTIDGNLNESTWADANKYTRLFENDTRSVYADIFLAHDGTYLYVGLDTPMGLGWDSLSDIYIDGDHDGMWSGHTGSANIDIGVAKGAPGAWGGYNNYNSGANVHVTPPPGYQSASYYDGAVSYEYVLPISDLTDSLSNTIGILFLIQEGRASKSNQYIFPATDLVKFSDPNWLDFDAEVSAWADMKFATVPLPSGGLAGLAFLGALGAFRFIRRRRAA